MAINNTVVRLQIAGWPTDRIGAFPGDAPRFYWISTMAEGITIRINIMISLRYDDIIVIIMSDIMQPVRRSLGRDSMQH